jgi:hypothetical protein
LLTVYSLICVSYRIPRKLISVFITKPASSVVLNPLRFQDNYDLLLEMEQASQEPEPLSNLNRKPLL